MWLCNLILDQLQKEFTELMKSLPVTVEDEDIEEMFNFADADGDGKLSYAEFQVNDTSILHLKER